MLEHPRVGSYLVIEEISSITFVFGYSEERQTLLVILSVKLRILPEYQEKKDFIKD